MPYENKSEKTIKDLLILLRFSGFSFKCLVGDWHHTQCQFTNLRDFTLKVSTMLVAKTMPKIQTMIFFPSTYSCS